MTYNFYMWYIDVIKQVMQERGLSQQAFADILGINQTTVSQWLLGKKKPGYYSILVLYEKFEIEPNLLFGIEK
ncbi:MAG: helix-turn-helix transcriptional regulator [Clostridia bacterium]|nr:helix-turn-helix transcriptional regulator [Clostridia bacterium]